MTSGISFGNLGTVDGKTVLTGGQSGIDTATLTKSLAEAKRLPAVKLEEKITKNNDKITQLNSFESKLEVLRDALDKLRRPSGLTSAKDDVFASRLSFLTASDGSSAGNYLGVLAENGAAIKNYDIRITNLAVAESRKSLAFTSNTSSVVDAAGTDVSGRFSAGTFQINGVNVSLSENDNLNTVRSKINAKTSQTGVEASILKVSDTDYRLIISSTKTGTSNAISITDAVDSVFFGAAPANIFTSTTAAENATITIDGETITRQSNTFSDAVAGVTFSLFQETDELATNPTIKVDIGKDANKVSEAIVEFIDAYNEIRLFYGAQNERNSDNEFVDTAILNDSNLLETISQSILSQLTEVVGIANPNAIDDEVDPKNLSKIGITFNDFDGSETDELAATTSILELDAAQLSKKIESNFDAVQDLFGFELSSTSSNLNLFGRENISSSEAFTILIDNTQAPGSQALLTHIDGKQLATPVSLTYDTSDTDFTAIISGTGDLAGLQLFYQGDGTSTEEVNGVLDTGKKDYTIAINGTAETAQVTHIHGLALASPIALEFTASGDNGSIKGVDGGFLSELTFLYIGSATESVDISFSQGFADKLYNQLNNYIEGSDNALRGVIADEIASITESSSDAEDAIVKIDEQVSTYTQQLLIKFAALEAAIASSNSVLDLLDAQTNARNNSN